MDNVFQNLFGRTFNSLSEVWLAVAYVVSMFAVLIFRPQQVVKPALFRGSYCAFALYLVLPALADGILRLTSFGQQQTGMGRMAAQPSWTNTLVDVAVSIVAKCLLAASICYGLSSLMRSTPTLSADLTDIKRSE